MLRRTLLLLAVPLFAGGPAGAAGGLTDPHACADAGGFTCSTLTVPLDHQGRARGTLRLQVAVQNGPAPKGVFLFLTGGPGQPGAPFAERVALRLGPALRGYRVVLVDQRGTGAPALQCPALQRAVGSSDLAVPARGDVVRCARTIGAKRRFFGTHQTIQDIDALRRALGVQKLVLDGVSYGSFVAERYAIRYPRHTAALVLDSVVPHGGINGLSVENMQAVARVLRATCRDQACSGDPAKDLAAAVARRPRIATGLLDALVTLSVFDPTYPGVLDALRAARQRQDAQLDALIARFAPDPNTPAEALSQGLHASALCADNPMPWGDASTPVARRLPALRRAVARIRPAAVWPFPRAVASGNGIVRTCLYWPPEPAPPIPRGQLPAVPTLLLNGDRDLSTPLAWARQELALAPRGKLVVVPGAGHSVQMRAVSERGRNALRKFLQGAPRFTAAAAPPFDGCVTGALRSRALQFGTTDGHQLRGVVVGSGAIGIVLAHEFGANLCNWLPLAQELATRGYRALLYDSRPTRPTDKAHLERDVVAAARELLRRGVKRVVVGGASAGGTAALTAAALLPRARLAGVVVLSSPAQFVGMDALAAARRVTAPAFFGVGSRDVAFVPDMRRLYAAAAGKRKQLVVVASSGHGTQLLDTAWAPASFKAKLLAFLDAR